MKPQQSRIVLVDPSMNVVLQALFLDLGSSNLGSSNFGNTGIPAVVVTP
jgi:hypothetical protein